MAEHPFGHEPSGIDTRRVLVVGACLALLVLACVISLHFVLRDLVAPQHAGVMIRPAPIPPQPRLQPNPQNDLAVLRAQKEALLSGYAWNGSSHQFARIPIERAMQIYAQQHASPPASATSAAPASTQGAQR